MLPAPWSQPWLPSLQGWRVGAAVGDLVVGDLVVGALVVGALVFGAVGLEVCGSSFWGG